MDGFTTFWNDTVLKPSAWKYLDPNSFTTFWNDTVLKHPIYDWETQDSFTTFWNDTVLKPVDITGLATKVLLPSEMTQF